MSAAAIAPAVLALSVSLDAVSSLGLVLMSYSGPFVGAMLPLTDNVKLNIAAGARREGGGERRGR